MHIWGISLQFAELNFPTCVLMTQKETITKTVPAVKLHVRSCKLVCTQVVWAVECEPGLDQTNRASGVKAPSPKRHVASRTLPRCCRNVTRIFRWKNTSDKRRHICVSSSSVNQSRNVPTYVPFPLFLSFFCFLSAGTSLGGMMSQLLNVLVTDSSDKMLIL